MYILTLHEDSNANITLMKDTQVLFSVAEERLTRIKYKGGFPYEALAYVTKTLDIPIESIDIIIAGNLYHPLPRILGKSFPTFEHPFLGVSQKVSLYFQHIIYHVSPIAAFVALINKRLLRHQFKRQVELVDHHTAHAYSAYLTSGYDDCVCITSDNYGDGVASAVFDCSDGICSKLYDSSALHSPGQFYGELAQIIGFHPLQAGKMTGLAAFGDPVPAYNDIKKLFKVSRDKCHFRLPSPWSKSERFGIMKSIRDKYSSKDIAAAAQKRFEDVVLEYAKHALEYTRKKKIALSGGIFGNVRVNQRIAELPEVESIFIHPGMSDLGISLGVALFYLAKTYDLKPFRLPHLYWGPEYSNKDIESALQGSSLCYQFDENIEETVAVLLSKGNIVARFNGKLEYGPRALGNRSILYQTTDPSVNEWLNKKLHRSEFMPFAPVTLAEYADDCYTDLDTCRYAAQFMTISVNCTNYMKKVSPAVVHVDGTARPQILVEETNPSYYKILSEYHRRTRIPSLINTSFNMHEEPIVCSPDDAIRAFIESDLDYLAIGNFLVSSRGFNELKE